MLPQLTVRCVLQQVFLAMPSACPVAPDGSKRSVPTGADDRGAVTMYTSDDNAETFKQVSGPCDLSSLCMWFLFSCVHQDSYPA